MPTDRHIPADAPLSGPAGAVATTLEGETIILDPDASKYFSLSGVGTRVWELLRGGTTAGSLVQTITAEFDVDPATCARDVDGLLGELEQAGLLVVGDARS